MTKENTLFAIVGLLVGLIIGFVFANSVNQGGVTAVNPATMQQTGALPAGHPTVPGGSGGSIPEVQAAIDKAKQNPSDFDAQMKAAELFYQIQRFDGAIEYLTKASELRPDNYEVLVNLGNAIFDAGRYEDAERSYTKALSINPNDIDVRTDLGLTFIFREKADHVRAIQELKKVLDADPNHARALQYLTIAYTKRSDAANAAATLARLEQIDGSNAAISKLRDDVEKLKTKSN